MDGVIDRLVEWMGEIPGALVYVVVAVFAFVENVFPPVPADVIALFGGFLAGRGVLSPWGAFAVTWASNVAGAMFVWWAGRRFGLRFFRGRIGRALLHERQMARLAAFYARHGTRVIFVSRFLPMFRSVVPVFAGTSGLGALRTFVPVGLASALWYGLVVYVGATAGENWEELRRGIESAGRWLLVVAVPLFALVAWAWWRTRREVES